MRAEPQPALERHELALNLNYAPGCSPSATALAH